MEPESLADAPGSGPEPKGLGPDPTGSLGPESPDTLADRLVSPLLHLGYSLVAFMLVIAFSPWWICRCFLDGHFRAMVLGRLTIGLPRLVATARPRVLVHGVSVGEVKAAQGIVKAIRQKVPEAEIVVSATTGTGLEVATKLFDDLVVVGFPVDFRVIVGRFLRRIQPTCVVLMELEVWPNFVRAARRAGVPVVVVNGRITERSFRHYSFFRSLLPQFHRVSLFCVQDETYAERFAVLARSPARVIVTGNVKGDGLKIGEPWRRSTAKVLPAARDGESSLNETARLAGLDGADFVIVAGSTHEPEEVWLSEAVRAGAPGARLVLVPRHPTRAREIQSALAQGGPDPQLWTALRSGAADVDPSRPLLVDTIGELEQFYALADLVFVGGSLIQHGGQNMLEPAGLGRPVIYGPYVDNFLHEARLMEGHGASLRVGGRAKLREVISDLVAKPSVREEMAVAGVRAAESQRGASERTLEALRDWRLL